MANLAALWLFWSQMLKLWCEFTLTTRIQPMFSPPLLDLIDSQTCLHNASAIYFMHFFRVAVEISTILYRAFQGLLAIANVIKTVAAEPDSTHGEIKDNECLSANSCNHDSVCTNMMTFIKIFYFANTNCSLRKIYPSHHHTIKQRRWIIVRLRLKLLHQYFGNNSGSHDHFYGKWLHREWKNRLFSSLHWFHQIASFIARANLKILNCMPPSQL